MSDSIFRKNVVEGSWLFLLNVVGVLGQASDSAQSARDHGGPPPVLPFDREPPPELVVDPPVPGPPERSLAVTGYRTENLHIAQVFGPNALNVSPRIGHIHVSVDDFP
jgi:hypothetical protein